jgi:myosin-crossreactive antigen
MEYVEHPEGLITWVYDAVRDIGRDKVNVTPLHMPFLISYLEDGLTPIHRADLLMGVTMSWHTMPW